MGTAIIILAVVALAFANGANDNFKGVATLAGSRTTTQKTALIWATVATFLGSLTAIALASALANAFAGKGLVPAELAQTQSYGAAVALAAAATVLIASRLGMPISTTHSLVGALVGAGLMANTQINLEKLSSGFAIPLITSPLIAISAAALLLPLIRRISGSTSINDAECICIDTEEPASACMMNDLALTTDSAPRITTGTKQQCDDSATASTIRVSTNQIVDRCHFLSAGMVSYARGLNDTPKIAAILLILPSFSGLTGFGIVGLTIAAGGLMFSYRVAQTMSEEITEMTAPQGLLANIVTAVVVIGASVRGLPVSTTHVSCGSLIGIGAANGGARWKMITSILAAWLLTLPVGALFGALFISILA